jgi:hypothetical protein
MSILRSYWNLGVGSRMLAYLFEWARHTDAIRKINLRVGVDNLPAIHLYEKYGFVQVGRVTREFYLRGQFVDVYMMGLQLDSPQALPADSYWAKPLQDSVKLDAIDLSASCLDLRSIFHRSPSGSERLGVYLSLFERAPCLHE